MKVAIVGAGLLGTSLGLALRAQAAEVWMSDRDPLRAALAADLMGARVGLEAADLVVAAVPTNAIPEVVIDAIQRNLAPTVTDLGSVKTKPLLEIQGRVGKNVEIYVPGHPMAGRERSGPEAARSDLFEGRPWILTPLVEGSARALEAVSSMARSVGAVPVLMGADEHDRSVAAISHLPQLVASMVAGLVGTEGDRALSLSGQGLKDLTRIAGSDPDLWAGILTANAERIAPLWRELMERAAKIDAYLNQQDEKSIYTVIAEGNSGRARLPGKHGGLSTNYVVIPVIVDDRPGQLGALFAAAGEFGINIEDLAMEHSPEQESGLVELSVLPAGADGFIDYLTGAGWRVHPPRRLNDPLTER